jgi:rRNA maturation endonuclease Nob1
MTLVFWGITCAITFESPVEQFLNEILSDAKKQNTVETQIVEDKGEVLDSICEKVESTDENAAYIADMMCNVRTEVKEIKPLAESVEKIKMELHYLCGEVNTLKETSKFPALCLACGKPLMPDFKICPYCGEPTRNLAQVAIPVESYK